MTSTNIGNISNAEINDITNETNEEGKTNGITNKANNVENTNESLDNGTVQLQANTQSDPMNKTLPDLVSNVENPTNDYLEANTTKDEDDAVEALLQLSKSTDVLLEVDTELPIGTPPVDVALVPIALGNQDVLNAI